MPKDSQCESTSARYIEWSKRHRDRHMRRMMAGELSEFEESTLETICGAWFCQHCANACITLVIDQQTRSMRRSQLVINVERIKL